MKITVLGAGSWGTTLALLMAHNNRLVHLWEFRPDAAALFEQQRENSEFLPGHRLPDNLRVTNDIGEAVSGASLCLMAVPTHAVRVTLSKLKGMLPPEVIFVSATKGIEQKSLMRISEIIRDVLGGEIGEERIVALSGPSLASEVVLGLPTTVVAASKNLNTAQMVQRLLSSEKFRVYAHDDIIGVELGGSVKNVIAIAAGITDGLGFGDNTKGALLTRGIVEIARLGVKLGGRPATFAGLSGMGDLITTCCSKLSRNRYVGEQLGKGRKLADILAGMIMVAEGVRSTESTCELARREGIEMPISEQVYRVLFEDLDPLQATVELMTRKLKVED